MTFSKKIHLNIISFIVALALVISMTYPSIANANSTSMLESQNNAINKEVFGSDTDLTLNILKDDLNERIVETVENGIKSVAVYNKKDNTMTLKIDGQEEVFFDLDEYKELEEKAMQDEDRSFSTNVASVEENTINNYEYTMWYTSPYKMEMRVPDSLFGMQSKTVYKTGSTERQNNFEYFRTAVDSVNDYEALYIATGVSATILWLASAIAISLGGGTAVAVALTAAGVTGAAYRYGILTERACKSALHYYNTF